MLKPFLLYLYIFLSFSLFSQEKITLISWNIQDFGQSKNSDELEEIANILRNADIVAIQEVVAGYGGAQAVAKLSDILNRMGSKWDYVISSPTNSPKFAAERYAIIWKTKQIKIKNRGALVSALEKMVDREPFYLNFYVDDQKFSVLNFHSRPHNKNPEDEIKAITHYLNTSTIERPLILAGDFNVDEKEAVFNGLKDVGFKASVSNKKTTLKKSCGQGYLSHAIDNIFYSDKIAFLKSGTIDYVGSCENLAKARKLSDHLPVFLEFELK
ncbi:endonuclease/exonuclease/phosphatase family protein [Pseudozobellia sp. WGM2]|uniref:endonuclease/exonuclease/phosphatase family protein n=1 Tax=Pseudozobellia sp. WGM2 TaxID=2787625 RepID=UPI001AE0480A|nr:endonuclease/exonuclease/phosphatase family protein [Pseudozobellia sp. WGM2]